MHRSVSLAALLLLALAPAPARAADPGAETDAGAAPPAPSWLADLPAVSDDGQLVAIANHESLGARGDERLLLDFVDAGSDRLVRRIIVSDPDHPESRAGAEKKARALLGERTWVKLRKATGQGLDVQYREPLFAVRDVATGGDLLRRKVPAWSHPATRPCPGCDVCPPPRATLQDAWVDHSQGVVLVDVAFTGGTDVCWEPPDDWHVVALPPSGAPPPP